MLTLSCLKCPVLKTCFIGYVNIPSLRKHYENDIFKCTLNILKQILAEHPTLNVSETIPWTMYK